MRWSLLALPLAASAATLEQQAAQADFVKYDELKPQFKTGARRTLSKFGRTSISRVEMVKVG
jgi:hypothetical protein